MVHYRSNGYGEKVPYYSDTYLVSAVFDDTHETGKTIKGETKTDSIIEARAMAVSFMKKSNMKSTWANILKDNPLQPSDKNSHVQFYNGKFYWIPPKEYCYAIPLNTDGTLSSRTKLKRYWLQIVDESKNQYGYMNNTKVIVCKNINEARLIAIKNYMKKNRMIFFSQHGPIGIMRMSAGITWEGTDQTKIYDVSRTTGSLMLVEK